MHKNILYFVLITICCIFSQVINAQSAPGLLGKKLTLSYDFNPYINYDSPRYINDEPSFIEEWIAYKHIVGVEYALTRTLSIGADFGSSSQRLSDNDYRGIVNEYFYHNLTTREVGLRLKYFPIDGGGIAPLGPYMQFRLIRFSYKSEMNLEEEETTGEPLSFIYAENDLFTGSFAFGQQGVLFDNILYNFGCEMALVLAPRDDENSGIDDKIRDVLLYNNVFKLKFGVVVPIF